MLARISQQLSREDSVDSALCKAREFDWVDVMAHFLRQDLVVSTTSRLSGVEAKELHRELFQTMAEPESSW